MDQLAGRLCGEASALSNPRLFFGRLLRVCCVLPKTNGNERRQEHDGRDFLNSFQAFARGALLPKSLSSFVVVFGETLPAYKPLLLKNHGVLLVQIGNNRV